MENEKFDLIVIGAGPGGYVAAIKAAQHGKKVALVEKNQVGGTCLNIGCIPTKTLLANAKALQQVRHAADFGIQVGGISFDYAKMKQRKDEVVRKMRKSLEGLIQSNQIRIVKGNAEFLSPHVLKIKGLDNLVVQAEQIIIATGSEPVDVSAFPCDHKRILNSTSILDIDVLPKTLVIIGGGYIGCEFASLFADLGVKVIIVEALPQIIALQGKALSDALTAAFKNRGIEIRAGAIVEDIETTASGAIVKIQGQSNIECDQVLVSVGRKAFTGSLNLEKAGVLCDSKGAIVVNEKMATNVPGIYAIGDVTQKFLLAHVASHQGIVAAMNAIGHEAVIQYTAVPAVIFTHPEIATVGLTLEEAVKLGLPAVQGKFPFQALGKAVADLGTEGFAQVVINEKNHQILGAQAMGPEASSMIAEMALAIANELTLECLVETIHAHPTMPEAWLEASLIAGNMPIHFPPKPKVRHV